MKYCLYPSDYFLRIIPFHLADFVKKIIYIFCCEEKSQIIAVKLLGNFKLFFKIRAKRL